MLLEQPGELVSRERLGERPLRDFTIGSAAWGFRTDWRVGHPRLLQLVPLSPANLSVAPAVSPAGHCSQRLR